MAKAVRFFVWHTGVICAKYFHDCAMLYRLLILRFAYFLIYVGIGTGGYLLCQVCMIHTEYRGSEMVIVFRLYILVDGQGKPLSLQGFRREEACLFH